jgi:hypothetical protein
MVVVHRISLRATEAQRRKLQTLSVKLPTGVVLPRGGDPLVAFDVEEDHPNWYQAGSGPDRSSCQLWVVPPIVDGGGIQSGSGSTAWGSVPQKTDWGEFQSLPPPPVRASSIDGTQSSAAVSYHRGFLGGLTYERQRAERLRYEADQQAALRGAVVSAGAALVIWSGGTALFAIEELTVLGGALGTTATQAAATSALRTTTVVAPLLLGEYSITEGLRQNDPGRIADGLMMAMSAGAAFGPGLGAGPRAGGLLAGAPKGIAPSSSALGQALEAAGHVRPPGSAAHHIVGSAAHHIVAGGTEAAAPARAVFQRFGIGINDAANVVFLPASRAAPNAAGAAAHSTRHTRA